MDFKTGFVPVFFLPIKQRDAAASLVFVCFLFLRDAVVQRADDGFLVHASADEYQLVDPVAVDGVPGLENIGIHFEDLTSFLFGEGGDPVAVVGGDLLLAALLEDIGGVRDFQ